MRTYYSKDPNKNVTSILVENENNPDSLIYISTKNGNVTLIQNAIIREFILRLQSRGDSEIDQCLVDAIQNHFPHLFLPAPTQSHLETLYEQMEGVVKNGLITAVASGKKLLVLAGEEHTSRGSLLLQSLLLHVVSELGIHNLMLEASENLLQQLVQNQCERKTANAQYSVPLAREKLHMSIVAADLDIQAFLSKCTDRSEAFSFLFGGSEREAFMASKALELNDHALFILGGAHIKSLQQNESLKGAYHVVAINMTCKSQQQFAFDLTKISKTEQCDKFTHLMSDQVVQINIEGNPALHSHETLVDIAQSVHESKKTSCCHSASSCGIFSERRLEEARMAIRLYFESNNSMSTRFTGPSIAPLD